MEIETIIMVVIAIIVSYQIGKLVMLQREIRDLEYIRDMAKASQRKIKKIMESSVNRKGK